MDNVDPQRIALWGTSFSGGHVVEAAVRDGKVAAVVSQCPMMDGLMAVGTLVRYAGAGYLLGLSRQGLKDVWRSLTGGPPVMLPLVAPPGHLAAMSTHDAEPGYRAIVGPTWRNEACARVALTVGLYRPGKKAGRLPCPILFQICSDDSVAPVEAVEAAARLAGDRATVKRYPLGHFDIYVGDAYEESVSDQLRFLQEALGAG
jgi:acetyl esterase/lipase